MSSDRAARSAVWSRYWSSGQPHACPGCLTARLEGSFSQFWDRVLTPLASTDRVLEVGAGNGVLTRLIAESRTLDLLPVVDAIDLADIQPRWLDNLDPARAQRVRFHSQVALEKLPFEAGAFSLVIGQYAFEYAERATAISEIARCCRLDSRLALVMHHADSELVRVARIEQGHLRWLLASGSLFDQAALLLPDLVRARVPSQLLELKQDAAAETRRQRFNELQRELQGMAAGSPVPDVLQDCAAGTARVMDTVLKAGDAAARELLQRQRQAVEDSALRLDEMLGCALSEQDLIQFETGLREAGFERIEFDKLWQGDKLMGWTLIAYRGNAIQVKRAAIEAQAETPADDPRNAEAADGVRQTNTLEPLQAALARSPLDAGAWYAYGLELQEQKQKAHALEAFQRSVQLAPDRPEAVERCARLLHELGRPDEAVPLWTKLRESAPATLTYWLGLAQAFWESGAVGEALDTYAKAAERFPNSADLALAYALALEDKGERALAESECERALRLKPGWPYALGSLLELKKSKVDDGLVSLAESLLRNPVTPAVSRALLGFGLGKVYDSKAQYPLAFKAWQEANTARRQISGPLNLDALTRRVDRQMKAFNRELYVARAAWGSPDERPVFIVGMPRSGTSLVEQIISAHPQAVGCGELADMARIAADFPRQIGTLLPWPEAVSAMNPAINRTAAERYLRVLERRAGREALRITDKQPLNFFHLGLIALLFPNSRVVWCCRDPRDICLSIYSENFAVQQSFATSLEDLAFYYREQERLMKYWQAALPIVILPLVYEELVEDFEPKVRQMLNFLGLPFAKECLEFHRKERAVLTPSRWQVRQPLYGSSVGRWKRYEAWLGPLFKALEERHADSTGT